MPNANLFFHVHSDSTSTMHASPVKECRKLLHGRSVAFLTFKDGTHLFNEIVWCLRGVGMHRFVGEDGGALIVQF